ncbi:ArnT family glycosyltransferase [Methylobacter sp. sgz302048]|uniref:ArnT family glycosyltransferase n=1 Tax=Methylobacter sp. sgz302048 TaxID=3455945 RepID=UPI003FA0B0B9
MIRQEKLVNNWPGIALALLASLVVYLSNLSIAGPMIQADEGSYLANAAALAGFPNDLAGSYNAGYSLLLVPAYWFASTPEEVWAGVKVINALLFFISVMCLWIAAKILSPNSSKMHLTGAVALVSLYPMWVVLAGYSFAQIAFVPFFLTVFIALSKAIENGWLTWLFLGIVAGFLYWIHPTAIAVLIALVFSCTFIAIKRHAFIEYVILLATLAAMVLFYKFGFTPWLYERMTISGEPPNLHYPSFSKMIAPLLSFNGLTEVAVRLSGHVFYLILGTVGLIGAGLFNLSSKMLKSRHETYEERTLFYRAVGIFLWLSILGIIALSVLLFSTTPEAQRLDHWMYGRYVEGVIAPVLLAGTLLPTYRTTLWALPVLLVCTVLFWMGLGEYSGNARFNVSAFWQQFYLQEKSVLAWAATGGVIILLVGLIPRRMGMMLIASLFVFSAYLQIDWHDHASNIATSRWKAALKVRGNYPLAKCVGFDHSDIDSYEKHVFWFDAGFILFDYALQRMSFDRWISTCDGPLFSYDRYLDERSSDIHIEAVAPHGGPYLWVKGKLPSEKHYPMNVENRSISPLQTLGEGWYDLEASHVWSSNLATLKLPVVDHCRKRSCFVTLKLAAYGASKDRPVKLLIKNTKNGDWSEEVIFKNSNIVPVHLPLNGHYLINRFSLSVPDAISPKDLQGSNDPRILGVALSEITLDGELSVNGAELLRLPKTVGRIEGSAIISDGREGFLAFGPYQSAAVGKYKLILRGKSGKLDSAFVDIVSSQGTVQHGKFILQPTVHDGGVLAEGQVQLDAPVEDIEIRVYVGAEDDVTLEGYELMPVETEDHSASLEHNPLN